MADIRSPATGSNLVAAQARIAPVRSEAVRAAQRAFFDAALNGTSPQTGAPPARASTPTQPLRTDMSPDRILRPGSILDIKV